MHRATDVNCIARLLVLSVLLVAPAFAQQPPASVVQVAKVSRTELAPTVAVPGTVFSRNNMQVTAGVSGQLLEVVEPGTFVEQGQSIARVDSRPLRLLRAEQEALLERAEINIRQLDSQLRRQRELSGSSLVSEFEVEQTQANRDLAISEAKITRVRIRQIDDQIQRADIKAPFSGVVISRAHRAGENVAQNEVLAQITDSQNLEVRAFVPLKHLPRTTVGDSLDVFAANARYSGRVRALVPTADVRSQTFEAIIDLPAQVAGDWAVGQLVSVAMPIRALQSSLTVPRDALVLRSEGTYVYRITDENKAERIEVEIGDSSGTLVAITGLLSEGDRIAIRGAENLRDGTDVRIIIAQQSTS